MPTTRPEDSGARVTLERTSVRGFTLIELMVTVTIISILAVLAVVGYRRVSANGKAGEAIAMLGGIMTAEEAAKIETGAYVNASDGELAVNGRTSNCYPPGTPTTLGRKIAWTGWASSTVNDRWASLAVNATGPVSYCYTAVAGAAGVAPSAVPGNTGFQINGTAVAWPDATSALVTRGPWVIAGATLDYDGDGTFQSIVLSSWGTNPMYDNEGE